MHGDLEGSELEGIGPLRGQQDLLLTTRLQVETDERVFDVEGISDRRAEFRGSGGLPTVGKENETSASSADGIGGGCGVGGQCSGEDSPGQSADGHTQEEVFTPYFGGTHVPNLHKKVDKSASGTITGTTKHTLDRPFSIRQREIK